MSSVLVGSYGFSASYSDYQTATDSASITSSTGQSVNVQLDLYPNGVTPPPPGFDLLKIIKDLLNNVMVKQVLLYGGMALAGLSVVGFVLPKSKRNGYYPSPQHY